MLGIIIGLLIGILFVMSNNSNTSKAIEKPIETNIITESMLERFANRLTNKLSIAKKDDKTLQTNNYKVSNANQTDDIVENKNMDTTSVKADSNFTAKNVKPVDDIIVKKDQLIKSKFINVTEIKSNITNDSAIAALANIPANTSKKNIIVEFWESPINYKGYKSSDFKIIVYGIKPEDVKSIKRIQQVIYMKVNEQVFQIDNRSDFSTYDEISNKQILQYFN